MIRFVRWIGVIVLLVACGGPAAPAAEPAKAPAAPAGTKYSEDFALPTRDMHDVSLSARARIRVREGRRKDVDAYGGPDWYWTRVRPELRAAVRFEVQRRDLTELRTNTAPAAAAVLERLRGRFAGTPFEFVSVELVRVRER